LVYKCNNKYKVAFFLFVNLLACKDKLKCSAGESQSYLSSLPCGKVWCNRCVVNAEDNVGTWAHCITYSSTNIYKSFKTLERKANQRIKSLIEKRKVNCYKRRANVTTRNITKREVTSKTKLLSTCYISHFEFLHVRFLSVLKDSHSNERGGTHGVTMRIQQGIWWRV